MKYSFVDGHCDTIVRDMNQNEVLLKNTGHIDIERLLQYDSPIQFFAIWLDKKYYSFALRETIKVIDFFYDELEKNKNYIRPVYTYDDILENKKNARISAVLAIEGGEALDGELSSLRILYRLGVRAMTLTWNYRNSIADGVGERETGGGLTKFGKNVVREMNHLGMIVDVSHLSETGFWDVEKICEKPFIASHSNATAICNAPRNLTDDQLRAISDHGGVVGLNMYSSFVTSKGKGTIDDIMRHIDHILNVTGEDCLGFGCDYDGIDTAPDGLDDVMGIKKILFEIDRVYGRSIMEKIAEKNYLRVISEVL